MTKTLSYSIIIILYILTIVCIFGALGTMLTKKYEMDETYWRIDGNEKSSEEQKRNEVEQLDSKGRQLDYKSYILTFIVLTTFITATGLIIKRKKILRTKKAAANKGFAKWR